MAFVERRLHYRLPIRVPVFLKGLDRDGNEFFELTHTMNVSASGACFLSKRKLNITNDLLVSIPAPVDTSVAPSEGYEFKFPARIVRIDKSLRNGNNRISVQFNKLLHQRA